VAFRRLIANDGRFKPHRVADPVEEVALLQYTGAPRPAQGLHADPRQPDHRGQMFALTGTGQNALLEDARSAAWWCGRCSTLYALTAVMLRANLHGDARCAASALRAEGRWSRTWREADHRVPGLRPCYRHRELSRDRNYDLPVAEVCGSGGAPLPVEIRSGSSR